MAETNIRMISGACNPIYQSFDWCRMKQFPNLIAYSSSNLVYILDIKSNLVRASLSGIKTRVNTLRFINNSKSCLIIAGGVQGDVVLFENQNTDDPFNYKDWTQCAHDKLESGISFISTYELADETTIVIIGTLNGIVSVRTIVSGVYSPEKRDSLKFGPPHIQETCSIAYLNGENEESDQFSIKNSQILVALGGVDNLIHVYSLQVENILREPSQKEGQYFKYHLSLQGHVNAITELNFRRFTDKDTQKIYWLLASASKDTYVRLWKFSEWEDKEKQQDKGIIHFQEKSTFKVQFFDQGVQSDVNFRIALESVLSSHNDAVVSVKWGDSKVFKPEDRDVARQFENNAVLITSAFDNTVQIWSQGNSDDVWENRMRLGQIGGNKNSFFNSVFSPDSMSILACTYTGSFYLWTRIREDAAFHEMVAVPVLSGHYAPVNDFDIDSSSQFIVSCSDDQTSRVFCPVSKQIIWTQASRAQIHGYDINAICAYPLYQEGQTQIEEKSKVGRKFCDLIVCGADQKIIRLYEPPTSFLNTINNITRLENLHLYLPDEQQQNELLIKQKLEQGIIEYQQQQEGGTQVLGLMTKQSQNPREKVTEYYDPDQEGVDEEDLEQQLGGGEEEQKSDISKQRDFSQVPLEDYLRNHTLWPELNQLYGHGYQIQSVTASHDGSYIASSSKSQNTEFASIIIWNPQKYSIIDKIVFHEFTAFQLQFSHNDQYLGSVGRDRQFALFKRDKSDPAHPYQLYASDKSHTRMIYSLSFSHDDLFIATGARDKVVKFWSIGEKQLVQSGEIVFKDPITAVALAERPFFLNSQDPNRQSYLAAVGFENGKIELLNFVFKVTDGTSEVIKILAFHENLCHGNSVNRLKFRPLIVHEKERDEQSQKGINQYELVSCSSDHSLRIFDLQF